MILNFDNEVAQIKKLFANQNKNKHEWYDIDMELMTLLAMVWDRGVGFERRRALDIIARKALNATELRNEINRPVR